MSLYIPILKRYPKAKPLALTLIAAAAEQGASLEELRYACEFAVDACEKGKDISVPTITQFKSKAEAALEKLDGKQILEEEATALLGFVKRVCECARTPAESEALPGAAQALLEICKSL